MAGQHWLVKSEPNKYAYQDLEKDGRTVWDGVRNFEARNNLRSMKAGNMFFITRTSAKRWSASREWLARPIPIPRPRGRTGRSSRSNRSSSSRSPSGSTPSRATRSSPTSRSSRKAGSRSWQRRPTNSRISWHWGKRRYRNAEFSDTLALRVVGQIGASGSMNDQRISGQRVFTATSKALIASAI